MTDLASVRISRITRGVEPGPATVMLGLGALPSGEHVVIAGERASMYLLAQVMDEEPQNQPLVAVEDWQIMWRESDPEVGNSLLLPGIAREWLHLPLMSEPTSDLQRCACGHTLVAHAPGSAGVSVGPCGLCQCREGWPMERES